MATETIRTGSRDGPAAGRSPMRIVVGVSLLAAGVVLLAATGGYYLYGRFARSSLDDLSFEMERPGFAGAGYVPTAPASGVSILTPPPSAASGAPTSPSTAAGDGAHSSGAPRVATAVVGASTEADVGSPAVSTAAADAPAASATPSSGTVATPSGPSRIGTGSGAENLGETEAPSETSGTGVAPSVVPTAVPRAAAASWTPSTSAAASITPSAATDNPDTPRYTSLDTEPPSSGYVAKPAEPDPRLAAIEASIAEVATYIAPTPEDLAAGGALATRIRIPAIEVDAAIDELRIRQLGDSLAWETPKRVVGHIPRTAKAGAAGQGWYFGHLESPLRGEGNVFARLPEIPDLAADSPIYIFLETAGRHYAYQVFVTEVVHEDEIALTDSGAHDITLVTCTPRFYYDHRLLVTAALVGIRDA